MLYLKRCLTHSFSSFSYIVIYAVATEILRQP